MPEGSPSTADLFPSRPRSLVNPENLYQLGDLAQMAKGIARCFIITTEYIGKKDILPRSATHGARFDLAEADLAQRKHTERLEENARYVCQRKCDGALVCLLVDAL